MFSQLVLPLTYRCNLNCEYCYVDKKGSKSLPFITGAKAIDFLLANGIKYNRTVDMIFTGGEPLLEWKKVRKLIYYAKYAARKRGVRIHGIGFPTNGMLLDEEILRFCQEEKISVAVSMDGADNKRKTVSGGNSFLLIREKLPLFLKYKEVVRIKMTVHPDYVDSADKYFNLFLKKGFTKIDIQPAIGKIWLPEQKKRYVAQLEKMLGLIRSAGVKNQKGISLKHLKSFLTENGGGKKCPKVEEEFLVDLDGNIYPCEFFLSIPLSERKSFSIGHIDRGIRMNLARKYQNHKICDGSDKLPAMKDKCARCKFSQACYKICLGYDREARRFDPALAKSNWGFFREIEKVYLRNKDLIPKEELGKR